MGKTKNKKRVILVIVFLILLAIYIAVTVRGEYLQALEIGEQYVEVFKQNIKYKVGVALVNFAILYIATYITTRFIKRGLKMSNEEKTTLQMILSAAIQEFLEKGFTSASLRNIAKKAGVTTGALYGYYDSKEDLFEALVGEHYNFLLERFCKAQKEFAEIPPEEQPNNLTSTSGECMYEMLLYAYEHLNEFKLILCCSEGTRFSKLIDEMVEIETKGTHDYLAVLEKIGRPAPPIDERLEHILITGMFNTFFELIIHEMPLEEAKHYLKEMRDFYTAGWMKIMGQ